jgi:hypothetical protein
LALSAIQLSLGCRVTIASDPSQDGWSFGIQFTKTAINSSCRAAYRRGWGLDPMASACIQQGGLFIDVSVPFSGDSVIFFRRKNYLLA